MTDEAALSSRRPPPVQSGYGHAVTPQDRADWQRWHDAKAQESYERGTDAVHRGDTAGAVYWLGRAARMAHHNPNVIFAYGMALLAAQQWDGAAKRMAWIARRFVMRKALVGEAIALFHLGRTEEAVGILASMLSRYAPAGEAMPWVRLFTAQSGQVGWCATSNEGVLQGECPGPLTIHLDGKIVAIDEQLPYVLPHEWKKAARLDVESDGKALYGSPIDLTSLRLMHGFVTVRRHRLEGWLWYPADPDFTPHVFIVAGEKRYDITASQPEQTALLEKPLARPRRFSISLDDLPPGVITLTDRYGQALTGSPLFPEAIALLDPPIEEPPQDNHTEVDTPLPAENPVVPHVQARVPGCLVIIPAYRNLLLTRQCIDAVLNSGSDDIECLVIDDASPEQDLRDRLAGLAAEGEITLIRHDSNRGFTASANAGLMCAAGRDVILLNSDALLPHGGIARLRAWLDRDKRIGTVTPFSNDATILSYPSVTHPNPAPHRREGASLDRIFASLPNAGLIDLPTGNGFCMAIRGDCLLQTGLLNVAVFAQGYGEENDFCCRASALGWRHVAATDLFVRHIGSVSFGRTRTLLLERNLHMLNALHPGYDRAVARFIASDPLAPIRRNAGLVRMLARRKAAGSCLIMVTHDSGGGVERVVQSRRQRAEAAGSQVIIMRPHQKGCRIEDCGGDTTNIVFDLPREWIDFITVLKRLAAERIEWHHLLGHAPMMVDLAAALDLRWDIVLHDYIWFCPRICLVGPNGRYCGEPLLAGCEACVTQQGSLIDAHLSVAELVTRSDRILREANRVLAGSHDLQRRMRRHFPGLKVEIEALETGIYPATRKMRPLDGSRRRICIPGAIGREKGYEIVLQLAEDAAKRNLPLEYIVTGYTIDDDRLLATGHVLISGEYRESEAKSVIESFNCDLGFIPSVWPETWCFALSNIWDAGLWAVSFDLGAQSERIQADRRGNVVPFGMPVSLLSNVLLHLAHQMI